MNYWLVQPNPTKFRIIDYYTKYGNPGTENTWQSARAGKVRTGDKVFCFKSKGRDGWRGILSLEKVTCNAIEGMELLCHEKPFVKGKVGKKEQARLSKTWGFRTSTVKAFPHNPICEKDFRKYLETTGLKVPDPLRWGIFALSKTQGKTQGKNLEDLIKGIRCQC